MYKEYIGLSQKGDVSTFVPNELFEAQKIGIETLNIELKNKWDDYVSQELFLEKERLWEFFSAEQIDSIGLAIYNFKKGNGFIIADETGIGKGRILSGIVRWCIANDKKVLFFTEREHLFTDFWRDLTDTETVHILKNPIVFHSTAKVFNQEHKEVLRGSSKLVKHIEVEGFNSDTNFVMTNYSQISLVQHKKNKKNTLADFVEGGVIILDESHNASGDSNTKKFLLDLLKECNHVVYSSATYIKDESQLDLYQKGILFDENTLKLFKRLLKGDKNFILRKIFTYELTKKLQFWRREHEPLEIGWQTIFCENDEYQKNIINSYSLIINEIFKIFEKINELPEFLDNEIKSSWFFFGATINRLSRNLLILLKLQELIKALEDIKNKNEKSVVVIDSTFSSVIKKVIEHQDNKNIKIEEFIEEENELSINLINDNDNENKEKNYDLTFSSLLLYLFEDMLNKTLDEKMSIDSLPLSIQDAIKNTKNKIKLFPKLFISPLDEIKERLKVKNITVDEISGRNFNIVNQSKIEKIKKRAKSQIVAGFNSGETDVMLITRAGASGISMHAGEKFKDQRPRNLFELEITQRPTYRLQFIGRVNRKNQVSKPKFWNIVTKMPFEQRILNVEQGKIEKMQSHISGDAEKHNQENIYNFYTDYCDNAIKTYLQNEKSLAKRLGINFNGKKEDYYYIDNFLKRCIILSEEEQNKIYDFLLYIKECDVLLQKNNALPEKTENVEIKTFWNQMDDLQKNDFTKLFKPNPFKAINQFLFPWVGLLKIKNTYHTENILKEDLEIELKNNLNKNNLLKDYVSKVVSFIISKNIYEQSYCAKNIVPLSKMLQIGAQVSIKNSEYLIYGYISNIKIPNIDYNFKFFENCIVEIQTMNPLINENIKYPYDKFYISLKSLFESNNIEIYHKIINWDNYIRTKSFYERMQFAFVGNPIYMEFIKQSYDMGKTYYSKNDNSKKEFNRLMYVLLPEGVNVQKLSQLKKPIYETNKIMEMLIAKKINSLTTTWQDEEILKPSLKLEQTSGGYNLWIAQEVWKDTETIDFPLRKKLKNKRGSVFGFEMFFLPYKEVRSVLYSLEMREVIWFY